MSVVEIIEAIEGPIAVTECIDTEATECEHVQRCGVRANWQRINQAVFEALDGISLSDMAEPAGARLVQLMRNVGDAERARVNS